MKAGPTDRRYGELARAVLVVLDDAPDGLPIEDVVRRVTMSVPPTASESQAPPTAEDVSPYEKSVRHAATELAKAKWLTKSAGTWRITDSGRAGLERFTDLVALYQAVLRRRNPSVMPTTPESVGDIFAGCFLSIAGALIGAILGTVLLLARMLPDLSLGLLGGFGAALVVGVVVGFLASFGMAGIARGFGRHAENIWLIGTAVVAAISAALTPSLLFAAAGGS